MTSKIDQQVAEFHKVMGVETRNTPGIPDEKVVRLRMRLIIEEAFEFLDACFEPYKVQGGKEMVLKSFFRIIDSEPLKPNLIEVADACADLDYVVSGTRLAFGIPGQAVADEVHRSNMAKAPGRIVKRDEHGKVQKPEGWTPPDIAGAMYGRK